jgi:ATP-dependent DNA helicase RecQ
MRLEKMQAYAELQSCRREYLLSYFGDAEVSTPCGACDVCAAAPRKKQEAGVKKRRTAGAPAHGPFGVNSRVVHEKLGAGVVQGREGDKLWILFDEHGRRELSLDFVAQNKLLRAL